MNKKSQLTIFIIIVILIISIIIGGYLFYIDKERKIQSEIEINSIKQNINYCLELKIKKIIIEIAKNGGYYEYENYINFLDERGIFYMKNSKLYVPNISFIENQINLWTEDEIDECFDMKDKNITKKYCKINTSLTDVTKVNFNCEVTVEIYNKIYTLKEFEVVLNISLIPFINASREIIENYKNTLPGFICIECLDKIGEKYNLNITVIPINKNIYKNEHVWFLLNSSQKIDNKFLIWRFVADLK